MTGEVGVADCSCVIDKGWAKDNGHVNYSTTEGIASFPAHDHPLKLTRYGRCSHRATGGGLDQPHKSYPVKTLLKLLLSPLALVTLCVNDQAF